MNKLTRSLFNSRPIFQSLTKKSSNVATTVKHGDKQVVEKKGFVKSLYDEYWNDGRPLFESRAIYRNNYSVGGWNRPKKQIVVAEVIMGIWFASLYWHLWYEFDHLSGHYHPPDPSLWTDAELGIPPDDEE